MMLFIALKLWMDSVIKTIFSSHLMSASIILRASFGTTKYCNSFIRGVECANPDCLYLHKEAPDRDCFLRDEMTIGDFSFYKATHPGHGSYWDRQQKLFLYYRKTSRRSGTELPNYHEMLNPSSVYFGCNPYEMDRLVRMFL